MGIMNKDMGILNRKKETFLDFLFVFSAEREVPEPNRYNSLIFS